MAVRDWQQFIHQTDRRMADIRKGVPGVAKGFAEVTRAAIAPGALDSKTKELIALAIGITARCDGCLAYHVKAAIRCGAGPSMIYGAEALAAYDAFCAEAA